MLKVKENVEMIKEMRKHIVDSLKCRNVTTVHADLAKIVLMYDYEESAYDNSKFEEDQRCMDAVDTD